MARFEREVTVIALDGTTQSKGTLWIEEPALDASGWWRCRYSIPVIHPEPFGLPGDDALQALCRTTQFVRNLIRGSIEDGFQIWWKQPGDFAGF